MRARFLVGTVTFGNGLGCVGGVAPIFLVGVFYSVCGVWVCWVCLCIVQYFSIGGVCRRQGVPLCLVFAVHFLRFWFMGLFYCFGFYLFGGES